MTFAKADRDEGVQPLLVGRLSPDWQLARHAAFALLVQVYLEQAGFASRHLAVQGRQRGAGSGGDTGAPAVAPDGLADIVAEIRTQNRHILRYFDDPAPLSALRTVDLSAEAELLGWLEAQHLAAEEPQVAYELAALALGVELPPILVRGLRQAPVLANSRVAELPDGSGYPTIFLSTLNPHWPAATNARLFVQSTDAEQLAAWAMLLLAKRLIPPAGSIARVSPEDRAALDECEVDLSLVYNPVSWLATPQDYRTAVAASRVVLL